ncbi:hypothetical protein ACEWY4_028062 [Coilia grayii]|uniref:P2X purinoreceptor 7 intracellular domain-containing protein n=1 Tax=Coilia grayii TaxID=363190 RepID=A0ABD1IMZ1_9TELE
MAEQEEYYYGVEEDDESFIFHGQPYLFEPEYSEAELRECDERAVRERRRADEAATAADLATTQPRTAGSWWCTCRCCEVMPTEVENFCCREWELLDTDTPDTGCLVTTKQFSSLIDKAVLETFFRKPVPEGPDGRLSTKQCRLVAYRVVLEWGLKGERLGRGQRRVLPSCVVTAIRKEYPSPSGRYHGFQEAEEVFRIM